MARKIYSQKFKKVEIKRVIGQWHTLSSVATWLGLCCDTLRTDVELAKFGSEKSFALTDFPASSASANSRRRTRACAWSATL